MWEYHKSIMGCVKHQMMGWQDLGEANVCDDWRCWSSAITAASLSSAKGHERCATGSTAYKPLKRFKSARVLLEHFVAERASQTRHKPFAAAPHAESDGSSH